ncbi:MAG: nucleotide-binding protein [Clostridiaceae bacterium]
MDFEKKFKELLGRTNDLKFDDQTERKSIFSDIELYGEKAFGSDKYTVKLKAIWFHPGGYPCTQEAEVRAWERGKSELKILLQMMIKDCEITFSGEEVQPKNVNSMKKNEPSKSKIFIVHGHDDKLKFEVAEWLHSLEIEPIILHLQPNAGLGSILGKIEANADVAAAIVLFTADDKGNAKTEKVLNSRARQNVVFEAGYFVGKLGPEHVIIIHEPTVELPGDLSGIIYTSTEAQWKEDIRKELNHMGIEYKRI